MWSKPSQYDAMKYVYDGDTATYYWHLLLSGWMLDILQYLCAPQLTQCEWFHL